MNLFQEKPTFGTKIKSGWKENYTIPLPLLPATVGNKLTHGLRARANPILAVFSMALVSTSPEIVTNDFGRHSCWIRALALPKLFTRAFKVVNGSRACWVPRVMVFSLVGNLWVTSAPTAVLARGLTL